MQPDGPKPFLADYTEITTFLPQQEGKKEKTMVEWTSRFRKAASRGRETGNFAAFEKPASEEKEYQMERGTV